MYNSVDEIVVSCHKRHMSASCSAYRSRSLGGYSLLFISAKRINQKLRVKQKKKSSEQVHVGPAF